MQEIENLGRTTKKDSRKHHQDNEIIFEDKFLSS